MGPIRQELAIADAKVKRAAAAASVIAARVAKLRIRAPSDGTVALLVAEPGEAVVPGQPVLTLDAKGGLRIGSSVELVPAGGKDPTQARITKSWRVANSQHAGGAGGRRPRSEYVPGSR